MNRLFITVEDVGAVISAGYTLIRVYTDTSETGTFITLDGTVSLVAAQESYEYTDLDGVTDTWYKTAYFGAVPGESDKSAARKGETSAAYATVKELRSQINKAGTTTDVELALILDAVSESIDNFCNRPDGFASIVNATPRIYTGDGTAVQWIDRCTAVSLVEVKDSPSDDDYVAWAAADWVAASGDPEKPDFNGLPFNFIIVSAVGDFSTFTSGTFFTGLRGFRPSSTLVGRGVPTVRITANWGESVAVPFVIKQATIAQAAQWFKRGLSSWQTETTTTAFGTLPFEATKLDPDIQYMLIEGRQVRPAIGRRY
jgi:hypothetical protein